MKNILLLADDPTNQCAFYRLWPFAEFRRSVHVTVKRIIDFVAHDVLGQDLVFVLRPHSDIDVNAMQAARQMGRPVWVDYDDDFLSLEPHHAWAETFGSYPQQQRFKKIASLATHISVSTRPIADSWFKLSPAQVQIIPNAFNDSLYALNVASNPDSRVIVWRGSYSHVRDLELIAEAVEAFPEYRFVFMGSFHHSMPARFPKATFYPFMPMSAYFQTLKELKPRAFMVPLQDTAFNRSKSNCVWLEATHAGAAVVASALPEFDQMGILQVPSKADWNRALMQCINESDISFKRSREEITKKFLLSSINKMREATINYLIQDA
jgi:hypothetical protein